MSSILQNKRVLGLIAAFAFVAAALLLFGGGSSSSPSPSPSPYLSVAPLEFTSPIVGQDLLAALALLKTIRLDTTVFSDPVFESLSDWGKKISPQPVGRRNPFAPLGSPSPSAKPAEGATGKSSATGAGARTAGSSPSGSSIPASSGTSPDAGVWDFSDIDFSF